MLEKVKYRNGGHVPEFSTYKWSISKHSIYKSRISSPTRLEFGKDAAATAVQGVSGIASYQATKITRELIVYVMKGGKRSCDFTSTRNKTQCRAAHWVSIETPLTTEWRCYSVCSSYFYCKRSPTLWLYAPCSCCTLIYSSIVPLNCELSKWIFLINLCKFVHYNYSDFSNDC